MDSALIVQIVIAVIALGWIAFLVIFFNNRKFAIPRAYAQLNHKTVKIISLVLFGILVSSHIAWNMIGNPYGYNVEKLQWLQDTVGSGPFGTTIGTLAYWINTLNIVFICIYIFYQSPTIKKLLVYLVFPLSVFNIVAFNQLFEIVKVANYEALPTAEGISLLLVGLQVGIIFLFSTFHAFKVLYEKGYFQFPKFKNWKEVLFFSITLVGLFVASMPPNIPFMLFGPGKPTKLIDFGAGHRWQLIIMTICPFLVYFLLKNRPMPEKMFFMLFIAYGGMLNFTASSSYTYQMFSFLWGNIGSLASWPLHLCNTAMFIIPLTLTFKSEKIFYFTYFINVLGALFAMFIPDIGVNDQFFAPNIVFFWYNHIQAMMMPLLMVALGIYQKPKWRLFWYSMAGFGLYYLLVLFMNGWLSNYTSVDFFFINSDFILDKLGDQAKNMLNIQWTFTVGKSTFTYYPLYQSLFFTVYIGLALAMWFIYINAYSFSEKIHIVNVKNKKMKAQQQEFINMYQVENDKLPIIEGGPTMIKLEHFSKRYGNSPVYAVYDVSFEVKPGEIFGFLGPNGAGKSSIIKCIVGIQPGTSGSAIVCGYNVEHQAKEAKLNIGFVPDHYALYENLTGREYINYIADMYHVSREDRTNRIIDMVGRFELEKAFDNQIKTYSHGMKQKIAIIAALIHEPKIWILDEPLTGLDPQSIFQVKEMMKEYAKKGNIVFFSSHIMDVVERLCDSFAIIKFGHIIKAGSMKDVDKSKLTLEEFYMKTISDESVIPTRVSKEIRRQEDISKKEERAEFKKEQKQLRKEKKLQRKEKEKTKKAESKDLRTCQSGKYLCLQKQAETGKEEQEKKQ